jgi:hypothetical protein
LAPCYRKQKNAPLIRIKAKGSYFEV